MDNKEMETRLQSAVEHAAPDVLESILSACDRPKGEVLFMETMEKKKGGWIKPLAGLAAAVAIAVGGYLSYQTMQVASRVDAIVGIDVNPSIELKLNSKERVLEANARNADAEAIIGGMDLSGASLDLAMNAIMGSMLKNGYLDELANSVLITVEDQNRQKGDALAQRLTQEVEAMMRQNAMNAAILSQTLDSDNAPRQMAEQYNISVGKANLINQLLGQNTLLRVEDLAGLSVNDLNLLAESQTKNLGEIRSTGTASSKAYIGETKAKSLALQAAGLTANQVTGLRVQLDRDDGRMVYEVDFFHGNIEYEVELDAVSGQTVKIEKDGNDNRNDNDDRYDDDDIKPSQAPKDTIGVPKARELALTHAGVSKQAATQLKSKLEYDDDRNCYIYDVDFKAGGREYDYDIDAVTGKILKSENEKDDDHRGNSGSSSNGSSSRDDDDRYDDDDDRYDDDHDDRDDDDDD